MLINFLTVHVKAVQCADAEGMLQYSMYALKNCGEMGGEFTPDAIILSWEPSFCSTAVRQNPPLANGKLG